MARTSPAAALKAAGLIGVWETDVGTGHSILDRDAAALLSGDPHLAGRPLNLDAALARIHPDDREWVFARIRRVRRTGGAFCAEFRILTGMDEVRWILNRGSLAPGPDGAMRGRGVYIDTTDDHRTPCPGREPEEAAPTDEAAALSAAAAHCLCARQVLSRSRHGFLRLLLEMLEIEIGRVLARRLHS